MRVPALTAALVALSTQAAADVPAFIRYLEADGRVIVKTDGPQTTADTPFAIASVGKLMTSVAVLRLADRGALTLDDPVRDWLPAEVVAGFGGMEGVTVGHLLSMTSGLPDYLADDYLDAALDDPEGVQTPLVALSHAYGERPLFPPGTEFDYSNTNYVLAQLIAEAASGQSYADLIAAEVLGPAGMSGAFVFGSVPLPADFPTGHEDGEHIRSYYTHDGFGDGGVIASAADLARFYRALFLDRTLLSAASMSDLTRDPLGVGYGLGVEIDGPIRGHSGGDLGFSSDIRLDLRDGAIAILLVADAEAETDWTGEVLADR